MPTFSTAVAVIQAGESLSSTVDCTAQGTSAIAAIIFPDDWTSAPLTFQISADNIKYANLYHYDGRDPGFAVVPGGAVIIPPEPARGMRYIKLRSGTADQPVPQKADRTFDIVLVA